MMSGEDPPSPPESPRPGYRSFEHQDYRGDSSTVSTSTRLRRQLHTGKKKSLLSRLGSAAWRWWYIPAAIAILLLYLSVKFAYNHGWNSTAAGVSKEAVDAAWMGPEQVAHEDCEQVAHEEREQVKHEDREQVAHEEPERVVHEEPQQVVHEDRREQVEQQEASLWKRADHANAYSGARIYESSKTANFGSKVYWRFLFQESRNPELVIEKSESQVLPGKCWPMRGTHGYVTIELPSPIRVAGVSYEHAPLWSLRAEELDSAPKLVEISVGMDPEQLRSVGTYRYEEVPKEGPVLVYDQPAASAHAMMGSGEEDQARFVKFSVLENFGERRFTCLYRIRVFAAAANNEGPTTTSAEEMPSDGA